MGLEDWADVMDYSPLPSSFAEKLRAKAAEQAQQAQQDPQQQLAMQAAQAEVQKTVSEAEENQAQAMLYGIRAQKEAVTPVQPPVMPGMNPPRPVGAP
jgi:hypothetical protein